MQQNQQPQSVQATQPYQRNFSAAEMRHYFYSISRKYIVLVIIGAALFMIGLLLMRLPGGVGGFVLFIGLILGLGGGIPCLLHFTARPTDEQYARWVEERLQPLYGEALQRLHLDESQCESIIEVQGGISSLLQLTKKFPEKEIAVKRLRDGLRHYSINVCTYIFLTKDNIAIYSGYVNAFAQNERFEDADHYYYKDIVGVSVSGPVYTPAVYGPSRQEIQRQGFFVRISNGDIVGTDYATKVVMRNKGYRARIQGVDVVVAALLVLLRDHKVTSIEASRIARDVL